MAPNHHSRFPGLAGLALALCLTLAACAPSVDNSTDPQENVTPTNEGSVASPVTLSVGVIHNGFVGSGESSYYVAVHSNAIQAQVSNMTADVDLSIFEGSDFMSSEVSCTHNTGTTPESCTDPSGAGTYYILIEAMGGAATYDVEFIDAG